MTEKLRCWPGCVAMIVRSDFQANFVKRVKVLSLCWHEHEIYYGPGWECQALQETLAYKYGTIGDVFVSTGVVWIPDKFLTPITPSDEVLAEQDDIEVTA